MMSLKKRAGVMILISFGELLQESLAEAGFFTAYLAFFAGMGMMFLSDVVVPHIYMRESHDALGGVVENQCPEPERQDERGGRYLRFRHRLRHGAGHSTEFYALLLLSWLIANLGLAENSPAVIMGAMIVAPLLGPIFGFSAGVIWGSGRAIAKAFSTLVAGCLLVLAVTFLTAFLVPVIVITPEACLTRFTRAARFFHSS
jgi:hypothetical protein